MDAITEQLTPTKLALAPEKSSSEGIQTKRLLTFEEAERRYEKVMQQKKNMAKLVADEQQSTIKGDFDHDIESATRPLAFKVTEGQVNQELGQAVYDVSSVLAEIPEFVLERTAEDLGIREALPLAEINLVDAATDLHAFFTVVLESYPETHIYLDVGQNTDSFRIMAKKNRFFPAIYNILNNSRREIKNRKGKNLRIKVFGNQEGQPVLEISDDTGGFRNDMLEVADQVKVGDKAIPKAKAFVRGESGNGSSGLGLDMVWKTLVEGLGAEIEISNKNFQLPDGTIGKTGAVTTIKFPLQSPKT